MCTVDVDPFLGFHLPAPQGTLPWSGPLCDAKNGRLRAWGSSTPGDIVSEVLGPGFVKSVARLRGRGLGSAAVVARLSSGPSLSLEIRLF